MLVDSVPQIYGNSVCWKQLLVIYWICMVLQMNIVWHFEWVLRRLWSEYKITEGLDVPKAHILYYFDIFNLCECFWAGALRNQFFSKCVFFLLKISSANESSINYLFFLCLQNKEALKEGKKKRTIS